MLAQTLAFMMEARGHAIWIDAADFREKVNFSIEESFKNSTCVTQLAWNQTQRVLPSKPIIKLVNKLHSRVRKKNC